MKNHDDYDNDEYPWGDSTYDSEDCYGSPWQYSQPVQPRFQDDAAEEPVRPIDADVNNPPTLA